MSMKIKEQEGVRTKATQATVKEFESIWNSEEKKHSQKKKHNMEKKWKRITFVQKSEMNRVTEKGM